MTLSSIARRRDVRRLAALVGRMRSTGGADESAMQISG